MAKKKSTLKSIFKIKLTKIQTIFSLLFILILFIFLGLFFFSTDTGLDYRMFVYSKLLQAKVNYDDYLQNFTPISKPTPIAKPTTFVAHGFPPVTPPPVTPLEQLPNQNFNKVIVFRATEGNENLATFTKVITDTTEVKKLYDDIKNLPLWPQGVVFHCPNDSVKAFAYELNFYSNDVLSVHASLHTGGCTTVNITNYKPRMAMNMEGGKLVDDLQQALNLSRQEFYGY